MFAKFFKNSAYLLSAHVVVKILAFFYTIFLARNLGVENYGLYIIAISYFSLASVLTDLGVTNLFVREVAKDQKNASSFLSHILMLRLTSVFAVFILTAAFFVFNNSNVNVMMLNLLAIGIVLPQIVGLIIDSFFSAIQKFYYPAVNLIILNIFSIICGVALVMLGYGPFGALLGMLIGHLIYAAAAIVFLRSYKLKINFKINLKLAKKILSQSFPYGILFALGFLYYKIDILILSYFEGSYSTGIYGTAYKFLEAIIFIPSAFLGVLFPYMAKISQKPPKFVYATYLKSTGVFLAISLVITLLFLTILPQVIIILLPEYLSSIALLEILALSIPFYFMITPQAALLSSQKKFLKPLILISIFNLLLNVFLNFLFIPQYSYFAPAWITVVSDIIGFAVFFVFITAVYLKKHD